MLSLKNIVKEYRSGDTKVQALKGISIDFREHEFVSILCLLYTSDAADEL